MNSHKPTNISYDSEMLTLDGCPVTYFYEVHKNQKPLKVKIKTKIIINGVNFYQIPSRKLTVDICIEAIQINADVLSHIPSRLLTDELFIKMVKKHGDDLRHVPDRYKTIAVCVEAVKDTSSALIFCPNATRINEWNLKHKKLWMELVKISEEAYVYCHFRDEELKHLHKMLWEV